MSGAGGGDLGHEGEEGEHARGVVGGVDLAVDGVDVEGDALGLTPVGVGAEVDVPGRFGGRQAGAVAGGALGGGSGGVGSSDEAQPGRGASGGW